MKKELLKISVVSIGIYMAVSLFFSGIGLVLASGGASAQSVQADGDGMEKIITSRPSYRPLTNPRGELSIHTEKYQEKHVINAYFPHF